MSQNLQLKEYPHDDLSIHNQLLRIPIFEIPPNFAMQLQTLFAVLATAIATVQAGCYSGAEPSWGPNKAYANQIVAEQCASGRALSGNFDNSQTRYYCRQISDNVKFEFFILRKIQGNFGVNVSPSTCEEKLKNEINGCANGGVSTVDGMEYRSDPNWGRC
ncbi:hypothetical protein GQ44DRAFT_821858 [Phaeosphaeriaceae sp. PMI808]|nr:hypothetical protein GQ44DRAFT_821858 [Phaeosphaeriaceae sp. PMI808]